jgi:hypothetical protein
MTKQEFRKLCMDMQAILANMFNTLDAWPDDPEFRHIGTGVIVTPHTGPPYNEKPPGGPHVPGEPPPTSNG